MPTKPSHFFCQSPIVHSPGELHELLGRVWTLSDLHVLHHHTAPCWLARAFEDPLSAVYDGVDHHFANHAAVRRFGPLRTLAEARQVVGSWPVLRQDRRRRDLAATIKSVVEDHTLVRGWCDPIRSLDAVFSNVRSTEGMICVVCKPIRMLLEGKEVVAIYAELEENISMDHARMTAMQQLSPVPQFLFAEQGHLLLANQAGIHLHGPSASLTLLDVLQGGADTGEKTGMAQAHRRAMDAIFVQKQSEYQCTISYAINTEQSYSLFRMWGMPDPVTNNPAILVAVMDVTAQKKLELQLEAHRELLERQNELLEVRNESLTKKQSELLSENERLAECLESAVISSAQPIDTHSVADKTLKLLYGILEGERPGEAEVQALIDMIGQATDLRQPLQLEKQLLEQEAWGVEVQQSMLTLLAPTRRSSRSRSLEQDVQHWREAIKEAAAGGADCQFSPNGHTSGGRNREYERQESGRDLASRATGDICNGLTTQTERLLREAENSWTFDVFALDEASPKESLSILTFWLLQRSGLIKTLKINQRRLAGFLRRVEAGYLANPYHNRLHAAAVVQTMHMLLHHGGLRKYGVVDNIEMLACYIASALHDHEHPGFTNDFLVKTEDALATNYNDQSPLENHHVASACRLMQLPHLNFHGDLPIDDRARLRSSIIEQVLSTNMESHFSIISRFQGMYQRKNSKSLPRNPPQGPTQCGELRDRCKQGSFVFTDDEKSLIRQAALKVADISHLALPTPVHLAWVGRLEAELFLQGDQERRRGLPISPLMDRNAMGITRSQVGFFDVVALPLFRSFADVFPGAQPLLLSANANHAYWKAQQ